MEQDIGNHNDSDETLTQFTVANRLFWNETMKVHRTYYDGAFYDAIRKPGFNCLDIVLTNFLLRLSLQGKNVAHLCCNNGVEALSVLHLGAQTVFGFDLSEECITSAKQYCGNEQRSQAQFHQCDVCSIPDQFAEKFDIVLITAGSLCWMPSLRRFFSAAARILKPGSHLLLYEIHPVGSIYAKPNETRYLPASPLHPFDSYFRLDPWRMTEGLDYIGGTKYSSQVGFSFSHTMGEIVSEICRNSLLIKLFREYPHDVSSRRAHLQVLQCIPLSYLIHAEKIAK